MMQAAKQSRPLHRHPTVSKQSIAFAASVAFLLLDAGCAGTSQTPGEAQTRALSSALRPFQEYIDGTALRIEMIPVPGGKPNVGRNDRSEPDVKGIWIGKTEITWDLYDVFVYRLDQADVDGAYGTDAVTRPSKPYIAMDRGFGHAGYPAISMSFHGAQKFCEWLSLTTGRTYRLPTEAEWRYVCSLGGIETATVAEYAWYAGNADRRTHPVASKQADALGLHDLYGNASEWCVGSDGAPVTMGGTYRDSANEIGCAAREGPSAAWNASDPQFPKSIWWLADAGFVGFRVVCRVEERIGGQEDD